MFLSLGFGLLILCSTSLVGVFFAQKLPRTNSYLHLAAMNLAGMALLVWLASILEVVHKPFTAALITLLIAAVLLSSKRLSKRALPRGTVKEWILGNFLNIKYSIFTFCMGLLVAFLQNPSIGSSRMSFRIGPDLAGWTSAAKYFCDNNSRSGLTEAILQQTGLKSIGQAFRNPIQFQESYIGRIPSFTDQVSGEFLIGANRVGIPKLLSGYCGLNPDLINNIVVGGMIWATLVLCLLIIGILKLKEISPNLILLISFVSVFNINTISVLMEGGYGQFISTPFLISTLYFITKSRYREVSKPMLIAFLFFCLNAYQDTLIILCIFLTIYLFLYQFCIRRISISSVRIDRRTLILAGVILALNVHQIIPLKNLIFERFNSSGVVGGWDQGKIAFPINLMGVLNWLPYSSQNHSWGLGLFLVTILLSLITLYFFTRVAHDKKMILSIAVVLSFFLISFLVYRKGLNGILTYTPDGTPVRGTNNYQIWKLVAFGTPVIILEVCSAYSSKIKTGLRNNSQRAIVVFLIFVSLSSGTWMNDWVKNRSFSYEAGKNFSEKVTDRYDVVIIGNWSGNAISLILLGDVRYFLPTRGFQLSTFRSNPPRDIAYIIPRGQCIEISCLKSSVQLRGLNSPNGFERIYSDDDFIVFVGKEV